jgi:hypothetical protein
MTMFSLPAPVHVPLSAMLTMIVLPTLGGYTDSAHVMLGHGLSIRPLPLDLLQSTYTLLTDDDDDDDDDVILGNSSKHSASITGRYNNIVYLSIYLSIYQLYILM